jgi:DNA topoisomerase-3
LITAANKHIFDSSKLEDHHALIPLGRLPEGVTGNERNVYAVVLEAFFTVCMPDFVYNAKTFHFHIGRYTFTAAVREVMQRGWKEAKWQNKDDEDEEEEAEVPAFDEQGCVLAGLSVREKATEPKKEFSIDTLLAFMEHPGGGDDVKLAGLGTPATRAEILKTLFAREYIKEEKKKLYAASRGRFLLEQLTEDEDLKKMTDVAQTTAWEQKLADNPAAFEREIVAYVINCVKGGLGRKTYQNDPLGACPLCGKPVVAGKRSYSCTGWKDTPKCEFAVWKTIAGAAVTGDDVKLMLIGQKTPVKKCKKKDGTPFEAAFALEGGKVVFRFKPT